MQDNPDTATDMASGTYRLGVAAVLLASIVLRVALVWSGGQFTQLDEARYITSRESALMAAAGNWGGALAHAINDGDHVGAKLLGIIPASLEQHMGKSDRIPALFFGSFGLLSLVAILGIGRALGLGREARLWLLSLAAGSGSLFYFSRHILPYDAALALMLLALWAGLAPRFVWWRALLAGACAGAGFVIYYGYWTLGGIVLVTGTLAYFEPTRAGLRAFLNRAMLAGAALAAVIAVPVAIDRLWGQGRMIEGARSLSATIITGDFRGHIAPWVYLWAADRLLVPLAVAALGFLFWRALRSGPGVDRRTMWLTLGIVVALQVSFIVFANIRHQFAVHDRLIRQMTPFLCLGIAVAVEA